MNCIFCHQPRQQSENHCSYCHPCSAIYYHAYNYGWLQEHISIVLFIKDTSPKDHYIELNIVNNQTIFIKNSKMVMYFAYLLWIFPQTLSQWITRFNKLISIQ